MTAPWECAGEQASCTDNKAPKEEEPVMSNCQVPAHISKTGDNGKPRGVVWGLGPGPQDLWTASCLPQKDRSSVLYLRVSGRQDKKKKNYLFFLPLSFTWVPGNGSLHYEGR